MDGHVRLKLDQADLSGGGVAGEVMIVVVAIAVIPILTDAGRGGDQAIMM